MNLLLRFSRPPKKCPKATYNDTSSTGQHFKQSCKEMETNYCRDIKNISHTHTHTKFNLKMYGRKIVAFQRPE